MTTQTQPDIPAIASTPAQNLARTLIELLNQGNFDQALTNFSPQLQRILTAAQLQQAWSAIAEQLGEFEQVKAITQQTINGVEVIILTCQFATDSLRVQVAVDGNSQIAGLQFLPDPATQVFSPPSYADSSKFQEQEVQIGTGPTLLPGTLTIPKGEGTFPAVVLVHGSGPNDRDETIGANKPFRDLAWGLASLGIAVLRYDKRTLVYPQEFQGNFTVQEEVVADAIAAVNFLRQRSPLNPQINAKINPQQIYVLGHSLGGLLIPRIGCREPNLAGLIALAAPSRPFEDLFLEQSLYLANLDGVVTPEEQVQIEATRQHVAVIKARAWEQVPAARLLLGVPVSYWQDLQDYQPAIVAQSLSQRLLILQGERDYQVTLQDFQGWKNALGARSNATLKAYPLLNHIFTSGSGIPTPTEYQIPSHVEEEVIKDIAQWIAAGK